jgi:hypothetical protein
LVFVGRFGGSFGLLFAFTVRGNSSTTLALREALVAICVAVFAADWCLVGWATAALVSFFFRLFASTVRGNSSTTLAFGEAPVDVRGAVFAADWCLVGRAIAALVFVGRFGGSFGLGFFFVLTFAVVGTVSGSLFATGEALVAVGDAIRTTNWTVVFGAHAVAAGHIPLGLACLRVECVG